MRFLASQHPNPCVRQRAAGFTLIELLIVIAIIGVLIAMLLPAVNSVREAARRTQCRNHLKQIGLALHAYHEKKGALPPAQTWGGYPVHNYSFLTSILPFIDQQNIYDAYDFTQPSLIQDQNFPDGTLIGSTIISTYVCPSDSRPTHNDDGFALHNYVTSTGPTDVYGTNPACACGAAAGLNAQYALGGRDDPKNFPGPFNASSPSVSVPFAAIRDGLSNTIMAGEVRPTCSAHVMSGWARMNNGSAAVSTVVPINTDTCNETGDNCSRPCNWNMEMGFRSAHAGGAHFVMCDGSVHFFHASIDHQLYQYLGGRADGQDVDIP